MKQKVTFIIVSILLSTLFLAACGNGDKEEEYNPIQKAVDLSEESEVATMSIDTGEPIQDARYQDATLPANERAIDLLSYMTLEEKIGQMLLVSNDKTSPNEARKHFIGSIAFLGDIANENNTASDWADLLDEYQRNALSTRLGIPLLFATEGIHGHNYVTGATIFPHNIGLGATNNEDLIEQIGEITAKEMKATGIHCNFAPVLTNSIDVRLDITYEGYGRDISLIERLSGAYIRGLSGNKGMLLSTARDYLAEGYASIDPSEEGIMIKDFSDNIDSLVEPYTKAIQEGVKAIMISDHKINTKNIVNNEFLITQILKEQLEFSGIVVTELEAVSKIDGDIEEQLKSSINAGIDMIMAPDSYKDYETAILNLVSDGAITSERIDDAVSRILTVKFQCGIFEQPYNNRIDIDKVGGTKHRQVAREAVRESLVLLKNENNIIGQLKDMKDILVLGGAADDISIQSGDYVIMDNKKEDNDSVGTTFLKALEKLENRDITYEKDDIKWYNGEVAIIVGGEEHTESEGVVDSENQEHNLTLSSQTMELIHKVKIYNPNLPIVLLLYSGRPLILDDVIDNVDAIIAAWLPGSEGEGITDVMFGDYDFTGTLSYPWPKDIEQKENLFEIGYGLKKNE